MNIPKRYRAKYEHCLFFMCVFTVMHVPPEEKEWNEYLHELWMWQFVMRL